VAILGCKAIINGMIVHTVGADLNIFKKCPPGSLMLLTGRHKGRPLHSRNRLKRSNGRIGGIRRVALIPNDMHHMPPGGTGRG